MKSNVNSLLIENSVLSNILPKNAESNEFIKFVHTSNKMTFTEPEQLPIENLYDRSRGSVLIIGENNTVFVVYYPWSTKILVKEPITLDFSNNMAVTVSKTGKFTSLGMSRDNAVRIIPSIVGKIKQVWRFQIDREAEARQVDRRKSRRQIDLLQRNYTENYLPIFRKRFRKLLEKAAMNQINNYKSDIINKIREGNFDEADRIATRANIFNNIALDLETNENEPFDSLLISTQKFFDTTIDLAISRTAQKLYPQDKEIAKEWEWTDKGWKAKNNTNQEEFLDALERIKKMSIQKLLTDLEKGDAKALSALVAEFKKTGSMQYVQH